MSDFISIAEAKAQQKGSFIGVVIKIGDLRSGTTDNRDWTLKVITLEDKSGQIEFLAWDDAERKLFQLGHTYEFHTPWYKQKDNDVSIQKSKFGKIIRSTAITDLPEPPKQGETTNPQPIDIPPLPEINPNIADLVSKNTVLLMQIEKEVRSTMREFIPEPIKLNDQQVGLYVKENFRDVKGAIPDHG